MPLYWFDNPILRHFFVCNDLCFCIFMMNLKIWNSVGTVRDLSVHEEIKIKSLSSLIGAFKTTSSKIIHQAGFLDFAWQRSFHDHIIRNEKSYLNISNYIDSNPERWTVDAFFEKDQNNSNCVG